MSTPDSANKSSLPMTEPGVPSSYARKATGLVREVPLLDMITFNCAGQSPVPGGPGGWPVADVLRDGQPIDPTPPDYRDLDTLLTPAR